jgi:hypothetical protein
MVNMLLDRVCWAIWQMQMNTDTSPRRDREFRREERADFYNYGPSREFITAGELSHSPPFALRTKTSRISTMPLQKPGAMVELIASRTLSKPSLLEALLEGVAPPASDGRVAVRQYSVESQGERALYRALEERIAARYSRAISYAMGRRRLHKSMSATPGAPKMGSPMHLFQARL